MAIDNNKVNQGDKEWIKMSENGRFSQNQLKVIEWLASSKYDRRPSTIALLADQLGISDRTIYRWKSDKVFQDAITARARDLLESDLPEIYAALAREAIKGSFQHIKLAMEMTKEYTPRQEVTGADGEDFVVKVVRGVSFEDI